MGAEDGEVRSRDIVLRRRGSIDRTRNQVFDKIRIGHRSLDLLSYVLLFPDDTYGLYQGMVIDYDANSISIARYRERNLVGAGSSAPPVPLNH